MTCLGCMTSPPLSVSDRLPKTGARLFLEEEGSLPRDLGILDASLARFVLRHRARGLRISTVRSYVAQVTRLYDQDVSLRCLKATKLTLYSQHALHPDPPPSPTLSSPSPPAQPSVIQQWLRMLGEEHGLRPTEIRTVRPLLADGAISFTPKVASTPAQVALSPKQIQLYTQVIALRDRAVPPIGIARERLLYNFATGHPFPHSQMRSMIAEAGGTHAYSLRRRFISEQAFKLMKAARWQTMRNVYRYVRHLPHLASPRQGCGVLTLLVMTVVITAVIVNYMRSY